MATLQQTMTPGIRTWLETVYWKLERRIVPGLRSSQETYQRTVNRYVNGTTRWLDLGCGAALLPAWQQDFERQLVGSSQRVVGLDRGLAPLQAHRSIALRVCGDIRRLPFPDASFDLMTANMVVEHLDDPTTQFCEIRRVMAPGGVFVCHTPNVRGYPSLVSRLVPDPVKHVLARGLDGRRPPDVFKTFYRANSPSALAALAKASQLQLREVLLTLSSAVLAIVPPLALMELLWIRALRSPRLAALRPTMIATFARE